MSQKLGEVVIKTNGLSNVWVTIARELEFILMPQLLNIYKSVNYTNFDTVLEEYVFKANF